jgi:outer membrane protein W
MLVFEVICPPISGQVRYINLETTARVKGVTSFDLDINPWVVMISIGKKL